MNGKLIRSEKFLEFDLENKKLFIVKDHATALITWKKACDDDLIDKDAILFHIDQHTDFYFDEKNRDKSKIILEMKDKELIDFVINDLCPNNDEFIVNAMISGLIKDGISIYFNEGTDYGELVSGNYSTTNKMRFVYNEIEHNFYLHDTEDIADVCGYNYLIGNTHVHQDINELFLKNDNFILDIDLDFFTYGRQFIYSKHPKDIKRQITSDSFQKIYNKSKIISIALEPKNCGGIKNCLEILSILNHHWFIPKNLDLFDETKRFLENI
ncbi:MAG: UPF0489 family protein [Desulfobacteraceae bacterium]|nr:UPF0489 family protein [Desulfobacteraceae bacterium]